MNQTISVGLRLVVLLFLTMQLTGCVFWRLYQTKVQLEKFDYNFSITADEDFALLFKHPLIYNNDLVTLAKLQPTQKEQRDEKKIWIYKFRKVDEKNNVLQPEINYFWEIIANKEELITSWSLSSLFLKVAPVEFLELSLRALANAEINTVGRKVRTDLDLVEKITTTLPRRQEIQMHLGEPASIRTRKDEFVYYYRFMLDSPSTKPGDEEAAVTVIKLFFDRDSEELIKMSSRFAGLNVSINYLKLIDKNDA